MDGKAAAGPKHSKNQKTGPKAAAIDKETQDEPVNKGNVAVVHAEQIKQEV